MQNHHSRNPAIPGAGGHLVNLGGVFQNWGKRSAALPSRYLTSGTCLCETSWKQTTLAGSKDVRVKQQCSNWKWKGIARDVPSDIPNRTTGDARGLPGDHAADSSQAYVPSPSRISSCPAWDRDKPWPLASAHRGCWKCDILRFITFCIRLSNSSVCLSSTLWLHDVGWRALKICSKLKQLRGRKHRKMGRTNKEFKTKATTAFQSQCWIYSSSVHTFCAKSIPHNWTPQLSRARVRFHFVCKGPEPGLQGGLLWDVPDLRGLASVSSATTCKSYTLGN